MNNLFARCFSILPLLCSRAPGRVSACLLPGLLPGLLAVALTAVLTGCGPKDIGAGSADAPPRAQGVSPEDQLRYPVTGSSRTQKMLYLHNRPDVMANTQQWRLQQFNRMHGLDQNPGPEDPDYRAVPRQRSPFRQ